jgi:hypothetical protein
MAHTTLPKEGKVGTSSTNAPMDQVLAARSGSKTLDDALVDDDFELLKFVMVVS